MSKTNKKKKIQKKGQELVHNMEIKIEIRREKKKGK
jgi:hypothetical protein